ncbi:peptidyl-tRNA hydrolase, partial [Syncephalis pseudoplumigaleata]
VVKLWQLTPQQLVVAHDDMERPVGKVSLKESGSANGHNGIKSIINELQTDQFHRIRIGIDRPNERDAGTVSRYVLAGIGPPDKRALENISFPLAFSEL